LLDGSEPELMDILRIVKNKVETNSALSFIFDKMAASFIYKSFIYRRINKYTARIKKTKQYNVIIETSNICNARCVMCPHVIMKRKMGVMDDEVFDLIVKKLKAEKISPPAIILNGFGEPLTDRKIFDRVRMIKKEFPDSIVKFYTNLGLANEEVIQDVVSCGLDEINVSFNGYDKANYEATMKISYAKTMENLNGLIKERNKNNKNLKIRISMALVSSNDGDEKKFIEKWARRVDSVSVNKVHSYGQTIKDPSGKNKINFNKLSYPCKYIWSTIVFGIYGDIFLCCLDYEGEVNFGNIKDKNILDIFHSPSFEKIRELHVKNDIGKIRMCARCYTPYKNGVEWLINNLY
jgi:MoaA/NifB/PqqE/SkfB family radical SAM enzyme